MKKSTMFQSLLQSVLSEEEIMKVAQLVGYHETARKFSVYTLLQYWTQALLNNGMAFETVLTVPLPVDLPKSIIRLFQRKLRLFLSRCSKNYFILCFKNAIGGLNVN